MIMADYKKYNTDGRSSEDRALDKFAEMMIEKIKHLAETTGRSLGSLKVP